METPRRHSTACNKGTPYNDQPSPTSSLRLTYTGPFDRDYCGKYATYKRAENDVAFWLREVNGHTDHVDLNFRLVLAQNAYKNGISMPYGIKEKLEIAIEGRELMIQHHKTIKQNHDDRHERPLEVLMDIWDIFERPSLKSQSCTGLPMPLDESPTTTYYEHREMRNDHDQQHASVPEWRQRWGSPPPPKLVRRQTKSDGALPDLTKADLMAKNWRR